MATTNIFHNGNFGYQVSTNQVDLATKIRVSKVPWKHGNWVSAFDTDVPLLNLAEWKTSLLILAECPLPFVCSQSMVGPTVMFDVAPPSYGSDRQCKMNRYISARGKNFSPKFSFQPRLESSHSPLIVTMPVDAVLPTLRHKSRL